MLNSHLYFFLILSFQFSSIIYAIRLDVSLQVKQVCRTTAHGRYLLSDDNGYVCDALSLDTKSRCCRGQGEQYSCDGCNLESHFCNSYEFYVSCCISPARTQKDLALKAKIAKPVMSGVLLLLEIPNNFLCHHKFITKHMIKIFIYPAKKISYHRMCGQGLIQVFFIFVLEDVIIIQRAWFMKMLMLVTFIIVLLCLQIFQAGKMIYVVLKSFCAPSFSCLFPPKKGSSFSSNLAAAMFGSCTLLPSFVLSRFSMVSQMICCWDVLPEFYA